MKGYIHHRNNPKMQCSVCGQWKRLHGKDAEDKAIQRFYSCCGENGEFEHIKNVCTDCCPSKCPYNNQNKRVMTKDELSLLLFLECRAVDHGGKVDARRMNTDNFEIAKKWNDAGYIEFGRIYSKDIADNCSHWVHFTPESFADAHNERCARAMRMWDNRKYKKTTEK